MKSRSATRGWPARSRWMQHGFCLGQHPTDITDWERNYGAESPMLRRFVRWRSVFPAPMPPLPMGGMMRTSGTTSATMQPPAAEAHVDFTERCAERIAQTLYRKVASQRSRLSPLHRLQPVARAVAAAAGHAAGALRGPLGAR